MSGTLDLPSAPYTPNQPVRTKNTTPGTKYSDAKPVDTSKLFGEAQAAQDKEEAAAKAAKAKGGKSRRRKSRKTKKSRKTRRRHRK
jgi:hypothetical protein